jgi:thioredoxin reductase (NADPH)
MKNLKTDVLIIGAGPAGLTAAIYVARAGRKALVLEGRAATRMAIGYEIENYPGFGPVDSRELLAKFREQATRFGAEFLKGDTLGFSLETEPKMVTTSEALVEAGAVILATGRPFSRDKLIPGEERLTGLGVSYCGVCDGPLYRGREVAALGSSVEAADEVLALVQMGVKVHWITGRKPSADLTPDFLARTEAQGVTVHAGAEIKEIVGAEVVEKVVLAGDSGERTLEVPGVFIFREVPTGSLLGQAGLEMDHRQCLAVDRRQRTNLEGVFAAGDLTCGGLQVVAAAGEGCVAALQAIAFLRRATPSE